MADEIAIDPELLRAHAARVESVSQGIGMAADAAATMNMSGGAFGLMFMYLVPPATAATGLARAAIAASKQLVDRSAKEIRAVADDFDDLEHGVQQQISRLRGEGGL